MSCTGQVVKNLFSMDSSLRLVIATVTFGMGVDCLDVRSFGTPCEFKSYVQLKLGDRRDHHIEGLHLLEARNRH